MPRFRLAQSMNSETWFDNAVILRRLCADACSDETMFRQLKCAREGSPGTRAIESFIDRDWLFDLQGTLMVYYSKKQNHEARLVCTRDSAELLLAKFRSRTYGIKIDVLT